MIDANQMRQRTGGWLRLAAANGGRGRHGAVCQQRKLRNIDVIRASVECVRGRNDGWARADRSELLSGVGRLVGAIL